MTSVQDYALRASSGEQVRLSEAFGDKDHLVVLHNMGEHCPNCALWGDEYNGMRQTIQRLAGFAIIGPDETEAQARYKTRRGWDSPLLSARGTSFIKDLGFEGDDGGAQPGVSILAKKDGEISVVKQVNVMRDRDCPSVLEVIWMVPGNDPQRLAFGRQ
jgi:predicted dithiol-disulfide oxidoreductase (DUF899 family)